MKRLRAGILLLCWVLSISAAQARYDQVEFFHLIERNDAGSTSKALAEGEFSANTFDAEGFSALYLALREPAPAVADLLIEDPRTKLNLENAWGENALMMAALRGLLPQAIRMMELGAEVNKKGWAPLHYAASSGNLPMIQLLLNNYAYIDAQSPTGETPLMMAAARGTPAAVQMLLEAEADPSLKNKKRQTAIAMALERGNTDNAKIIRDWQLRGGKPAPRPAPRPVQTNSNVLPLGAGSTSVKPEEAAAPSLIPAPIPAPTLEPAPQTEVQAEVQAEVQVQAVPEPGQAAAPESDAAAMTPPPEMDTEQTTETVPTPASTPLPAPEEIHDAAKEMDEPQPPAVPSPSPLPQPLAITPYVRANGDSPLHPASAPSVADIIAQPASRALLQILSQPSGVNHSSEPSR
jgi:hypothetical protein